MPSVGYEGFAKVKPLFYFLPSTSDAVASDTYRHDVDATLCRMPCIFPLPLLEHQTMRLCLSLFVCVIGLAGCGDSGPERPETVPVSGSVIYNGAPVEGANVTFRPTGNGKRGGSGTTDADGKFAITTFNRGDGVLPGDYVVLVRKVEEDGSGGGVSEDDPAYTGDATPVAAKKPKSLLPTKYSSERTSDITLEATLGEPVTDFKIELSD